MTSDLKPRAHVKKKANNKLYAVLACAALILYFLYASHLPPDSLAAETDKLESAASSITKGISGTPKDKVKTETNTETSSANEASPADKETHALVHEIRKAAKGDSISQSVASEELTDQISASRESYLTVDHSKNLQKVKEGSRKVLSTATDSETTGAKSKSAYDAADSLQILLESYEMIVFSKSYCPHSKRAKQILEFYDIRPKPLVFELDVEDHGAELQAALAQLTGRRTVPNVIVQGTSIGGGDEMAELDQSDGLIGKVRDLSDRIDITRKARRVA